MALFPGARNAYINHLVLSTDYAYSVALRLPFPLFVGLFVCLIVGSE